MRTTRPTKNLLSLENDTTDLSINRVRDSRRVCCRSTWGWKNISNGRLNPNIHSFKSIGTQLQSEYSSLKSIGTVTQVQSQDWTLLRCTTESEDVSGKNSRSWLMPGTPWLVSPRGEDPKKKTDWDHGTGLRGPPTGTVVPARFLCRIHPTGPRDASGPRGTDWDHRYRSTPERRHTVISSEPTLIVPSGGPLSTGSLEITVCRLTGDCRHRRSQTVPRGLIGMWVLTWGGTISEYDVCIWHCAGICSLFFVLCSSQSHLNVSFVRNSWKKI